MLKYTSIHWNTFSRVCRCSAFRWETNKKFFVTSGAHHNIDVHLDVWVLHLVLADSFSGLRFHIWIYDSGFESKDLMDSPTIIELLNEKSCGGRSKHIDAAARDQMERLSKVQTCQIQKQIQTQIQIQIQIWIWIQMRTYRFGIRCNGFLKWKHGK